MKRKRQSPILIVLIILIVFLALAVIADKWNQRNKENNLYNIGNIEDYSLELSLPSLAVFEEFTIEILADKEISTDNQKLNRSGSVIEGTTFSDSFDKALKLKEIGDGVDTGSKNIDLNSFDTIKSKIRENDIKNINISYFDNPNGHLSLYEDTRSYINEYLDYKVLKINESGYLINYIDGYETLYSKDDNLINWENLKDHNNNYYKKIPGLKFVKNSSYYIYSYLEDISQLDKTEISNTNLTINGKDYRASLDGLKILDKGYILKFKLFDGLESIIENRFLEAKIDINKSRVYKVPKSSVFDIDHIKGLYFLDDNLVSFTPVKILDEGEDYYYISNNFNEIFPRVLDNDNMNFKKLEPFDKILIDPTNYSEGDQY